MNAAGPWQEGSRLPNNSRFTILAQARHERGGRRMLFLLHRKPDRWVHLDGAWLSEEWEVVRWAVVVEGE